MGYDSYDWLNNLEQPATSYDFSSAGGSGAASSSNPAWNAAAGNNFSSDPQYADMSNYGSGAVSYAAPDNSAFNDIWAGAKARIAPQGWGTALGGRLADMGVNALAGLLSPKPNMGNSNAMSSQMMASLDRFNKMNDLQAAQYTQNVLPLQNMATQMSLTAANPTERANRASADFMLFSNARRKQREQQLTAAGMRPGSPEWISAMADLDQADALGHADAYNKGVQTAYDTGSQQLTSAYAMHPAPNYGATAQVAGFSASPQAQLAYYQQMMADAERKKIAALFGGYDAGKATGLR